MNLPIKKKTLIKTDNLTIKPYAQSDKGRLKELLKNPEITKTFMVPDFESEEQADLLIEKIIEFGRIENVNHLDYGIYYDDLLIGFINDCGIKEDEIEIGYVIDPAYKGRGFATEAAKAVINELREMGFYRVYAGYFEENPASRRVMEKCGMHSIDLVGEETYKGTVHKCLYCEIRF